MLSRPEEGWFGQPKYSTPETKFFYVVSTSATRVDREALTAVGHVTGLSRHV